MIRKKHITLCFSLFLALSMVLGQLIPVTATDEVPAEVPVEETGIPEAEPVQPDPEPEAGEEPGVVPIDGETPAPAGEGEREPADPAGDGQGEETAIPTEETTEPAEDGDEVKPEEEGKQEYFGEADGVKVKAVAAKGAFPEGAILKVAKLDPESAEYKKAAETLDSQNYEYSGFVAMDIHFEVDGQEVEPTADKGDVRVELQVDKKELPQENAAEAIETLEVQHHEEQGAAVTAKPVAKAADSSVVEAGQEVKADFAVENFSTFTITWSNGNYSWDKKYAQINFRCEDQNGRGLNSDVTNKIITDSNKKLVMADIANNIDGYEFSRAYVVIDGEKKPFTTVSFSSTGTLLSGYDRKVIFNTADNYSVSYNDEMLEFIVILEYGRPSYDLYTYTLLPNKNLEDYNPNQGGSANIFWNGMGKYKISAPRSAPDAYRANGNKDITIYYSDIVTSDEYDLKIYGPDESHKGYRDHKNQTYPDIEIDGTQYHYDPTGSDAKSYSIDWYRLVTSDGANDGANTYNPIVGNGTRTYHLDGFIKPIEESRITVDFKVLTPGSSAFQTVGLPGGAEPFVTRIAKNTHESKVTQPTIQNSTWESQITEDGVVYEFDGWYRDEGMTERCEWNQVLTDNQTYYGSYKPKTVTLQITNEVTGNMGNYTDPFNYTLELFDASGAPADYKIEGVDFVNGKHTFKLTNGQSTAAFKIPMNLTYKVTQVDGQDHETNATNNRNGERYIENEQAHVHDLKADSTKVDFTNHKQGQVPTGMEDQDTAIHGLLLSGGAGLLLIGAIVVLRRRMNAI